VLGFASSPQPTNSFLKKHEISKYAPFFVSLWLCVEQEGHHTKAQSHKGVLRDYLKRMKVHYDEEVDALYLNLSNEEPDGVIEITEGVNIDTTDDGRLTGIEILKASNKMNLDTILPYTLDLDQNTFRRRLPDTWGDRNSLPYCLNASALIYS